MLRSPAKPNVRELPKASPSSRFRSGKASALRARCELDASGKDEMAAHVYTNGTGPSPGESVRAEASTCAPPNRQGRAHTLL